MSRRDNHQLPNLPLGKKLLFTALLLFGMFVFSSAWIVAVFVGSWELSVAAITELGGVMAVIEEQSSGTFFGLFGAHLVSLVLIIGITRNLFNRVAIPRGARTALLFAPAAVAMLDVTCWATLLIWEWTHPLLGPTMALESLFFLYLVLRPLREMWIYTRWKDPKKTRVVVVGGGFAGLYAAMGLDRKLGYHEDLEIVVVDKKNYFLFPPLLPSVAAGAIESRQVTYPFRRVFEATNIVFRKERVERIDPDTKTLHTRLTMGQDPETGAAVESASELDYDLLVLAPGSATNTFRTPGVVEHGFFMKELGDAIAVRNHIIDCFEHAARDPDPSHRRELLRFVVVGAGPTGVEFASELQDLIQHVLMNRYPEIDPTFVEVYVVQSGKQVLPGWLDGMVSQTADQLKKLQIKVLLQTKVVLVEPRSATLSTGEVLRTRTCVWCCGIKAPSFLNTCGLPQHRSGRVQVQPDLRVEGRPEIFVMGDAAWLIDPRTERPLPPLGQVAFQQGDHTAKNLVRLIRGRETLPFEYFDFGSLVSVGEHFAVVNLLGVKLRGFIGWLVWRALYLGKLVGFGNKVRVVLDWTLDLLVERSISQLWTSRQELQLEPGAGAPTLARPEAAPPQRGG